MLLGQTTITIDNKNRLSIPAKFRTGLHNDNIVVSRGFEGCLVIRSTEEFIKWQDKILQQSEGLKETRILSRQIFANSEEITIDAKGRVNLPKALLTIAEIKDEVVIIGMSNKLELWAKQLWEKFNETTKITLEEAASNLKEL